MAAKKTKTLINTYKQAMEQEQLALEAKLVHAVTVYCKVHAAETEASEVEKAKAHTMKMIALLDWFEHVCSINQHRQAKPFVDAFLAANVDPAKRRK